MASTVYGMKVEHQENVLAGTFVVLKQRSNDRGGAIIGCSAVHIVISTVRSAQGMITGPRPFPEGTHSGSRRKRRICFVLKVIVGKIFKGGQFFRLDKRNK